MAETVCTLIQLLFICKKNGMLALLLNNKLELEGSTKSLLCWVDWKDAGGLVGVSAVTLDPKCKKDRF